MVDHAEQVRAQHIEIDFRAHLHGKLRDHPFGAVTGPVEPLVDHGLDPLGSPSTVTAPGSSQVTTSEIAPSPAAAQPTAHHRAVSGLPRGNNSSKNVSRPPGTAA